VRQRALSAVDEVYETVRGAIFRGELFPGSRLRQDELSDRLGVSKIPVREALQRLAAEGLVTFTPNRGSVVRALSAKEALETYGLRRALEPLLLERSIPHLTIVDLAQAEVALEPGRFAPAESNWMFHRALYGQSGWGRGLAIVANLHAVVAPYLLLYTGDPGKARRSENQHVELLELCRSRAAEDAVRVLHQHLDEAATTLAAFLVKFQNDELQDDRPPDDPSATSSPAMS